TALLNTGAQSCPGWTASLGPGDGTRPDRDSAKGVGHVDVGVIRIFIRARVANEDLDHVVAGCRRWGPREGAGSAPWLRCSRRRPPSGPGTRTVAFRCT